MPQYFYYIYKFYMPQYYFLIAKVGTIHCKKLLFNNMSCEETFGVWRVFLLTDNTTSNSANEDLVMDCQASFIVMSRF